MLWFKYNTYIRRRNQLLTTTKNREMSTVSNYREAKITAQIQEENRMVRVYEQRLQRIEHQIQLEKESISQALDCNFFDMAKTKIDRIQKLREKMVIIQRELSIV